MRERGHLPGRSVPRHGLDDASALSACGVEQLAHPRGIPRLRFDRNVTERGVGRHHRSETGPLLEPLRREVVDGRLDDILVVEREGGTHLCGDGVADRQTLSVAHARLGLGEPAGSEEGAPGVRLADGRLRLDEDRRTSLVLHDLLRG